MNKKELNNLIRTELTVCLEQEGYKFIKSQEQFTLKNAKFENTITYNILDYNPEFVVEFFIEIRNEDVENIANIFSTSNPNSFKYSPTIIVCLPYFTGKPTEFKVFKESDIKNMFNSFFTPFYLEKIKPFFVEYSQIEKLSELVNNSVNNEILGVPVNIKTYQRSIILLKLTKNSDFEKSYKILNEKINNFPENDKIMFENTYNYLKSLQI